MTHTSADAHLEDGELLTLDDAASPSASSAAARDHVAACARCADRRRVLRQHSARVSSLIAELELPSDFRYPSLPTAPRVLAPRAGWTQQRLRRAAAVLLVVGSLAAVPPLRAWTVAWVQKGIAALTGAGRRDAAPAVRRAAPVASKTAPIDSGSTLWFDAEGPELAVEIASAQASGTLTLSSSVRPMTGIEVVNGAGETPLVREHGVRLINGPASTASYRLALPAAVQRVRVRIGDQPWLVLSRADVEAGRTVELRRR